MLEILQHLGAPGQNQKTSRGNYLDGLHSTYSSPNHRKLPYHTCFAVILFSSVSVIQQIQQLPWENMKIVREQPVCRMPSLHFIASHLKTSQVKESVLSQGVDTSDTFFVLNPTNDLANTQKTFQKWFEK